MPLSYIDDPKHWHIRAGETRILAEPMTDAMSKEAMLGVAAGYDRMAKRAEAHMASLHPIQLSCLGIHSIVPNVH